MSVTVPYAKIDRSALPAPAADGVPKDIAGAGPLIRRVLPDISRHVAQLVRIRWVAADWRCSAVGLGGGVWKKMRAPGVERVAPWKALALDSAAGRALPFGLGGETFPGPSAVCVV